MWLRKLIFRDPGALQRAVRFGDAYEVERLCREGYSLCYGEDVKDWPVFVALSNWNPAIVSAMVDGTEDKAQWAKAYGREEIKELVCEFDAERLQLLLDTDIVWTAFWGAFCSPEEKRVERVAQVVRAASVNRSVYCGTFLHNAAGHGFLDVAKFLVSRGADMGALDKEGLTPFECALRFGHYDVAEFLVASGAAVKVRDANGNSAWNVFEINGSIFKFGGLCRALVAAEEAARAEGAE